MCLSPTRVGAILNRLPTQVGIFLCVVLCIGILLLEMQVSFMLHISPFLFCSWERDVCFRRIGENHTPTLKHGLWHIIEIHLNSPFS